MTGVLKNRCSYVFLFDRKSVVGPPTGEDESTVLSSIHGGRVENRSTWTNLRQELNWSKIHREIGGTLGMVPLIINPIYTLYTGYLMVFIG